MEVGRALAGGLNESNESQTTAVRPAISLLRYSPAFLIFIVAVVDAGRWADPDLWGHIRFGQLMITHGGLPPHDIYSYSAFGRPWHDHEWFSEFLLALIYNHFGIIGLKLFKFACAGITMTLLALGAAETGASINVQLVVLTIAGIGLAPMVQFRPQLFDFMCLSGLLLLMARDRYRGSAPLWIALPIMVLWANAHGGFFVGLAALAVYAAVVGMEDLAAGRGLRRAGWLGSLTVVAVLATLVTPFGLGLWGAVAHSMRNPLTRAVISEWQPLLFKIAEEWHKSHLTAINFAAVIVLPVGLAIFFVIRPRGGDLALVAIAAMMAVGAYMSVRNMSLAVIASVVPLCRHMGLAIEGTRFSGPKFQKPHRKLNEAFICAVALVLAVQTGLFSPRLRVGRAVPQGAVDFMQAHGLHGNVLCDFAWGDYLIWHLAPASKVFIDGRYDLVYPQKVIKDYFDFHFRHARAGKVLDSYPHDFVLITPKAPVRTLMEHRPDWKLIYSDPDSMLFARAGSPAAKLKGVPVRGRREPEYFP